MKIVAVIPARLASSRFPRKVLYKFHGLPMVEHVRRRALLSQAVTDVFVATPDQEIADVIRKYGGKVIQTSDKHLNGTTRVAEAIAGIDCSHVLLLQGDEPLLLPRHLDAFSHAIELNPRGDAWNATSPIEGIDELDRHSFVKCILSSSNRILFCYRRSPCFSDFNMQLHFVHKMLGIMAFRKDFLVQLSTLPVSAIEVAESIEQLRIIEHGQHLQSVIIEPSLPSVNTPQELKVVESMLDVDAEQRAMLAHILTMKP